MISAFQILFLILILFLIFGDISHVIKQSTLLLKYIKTFFKK